MNGVQQSSAGATSRWMRMQATLGKKTIAVCVALVVAGLGAFIAGVIGPGAHRAFGALIGSWLFFTGVALGTLAVGTILQLSGARWGHPFDVIGGRMRGFLLVSAGVLVVLLATLNLWAPWTQHMPVGESFWLGSPGFIVREILASALLLGLAFFGFRGRVGAKRPVWLAIAYSLAFAWISSMWAMDFVVGPTAHWQSTIIGPYLFIGSFIAGLCASVLIGIRTGRLDEERRNHGAAIVLAVAVFWLYIFFSQYLTIWYANLPDETSFIIARQTHGWVFPSVFILFATFVIPFLALVHGKMRHRRSVVLFAAAVQFLGIWVGTNLLVIPTLAPVGAGPWSVSDLLINLGMLGAFVLSASPAFEHAAPEPLEAVAVPSADVIAARA